MLGMGKFKGNEIKGITHARIYLTSVFTEPRRHTSSKVGPMRRVKTITMPFFRHVLV